MPGRVTGQSAGYPEPHESHDPRVVMDALSEQDVETYLIRVVVAAARALAAHPIPVPPGS